VDGLSVVVHKFDHTYLRTSKSKFVYVEHKKYVVHKYGVATREMKLCRIFGLSKKVKNINKI